MGTCFFSFALALLFLNSHTLSASTTFFNLTTDQNALLAFKDAIISDPYGVLSKNWSTDTSICHWIGVSCGRKHRRVTGLNVSGFGIGGTIAADVGNLTFLRILDISFNHFTGSIPKEVGYLTSLKFLLLYTTNLTGGIPEEIGNLTSLQYLRFSGNQMAGNIPSSIFNISSLKVMDISMNSFSGSIPTLNYLPELERLYLNNNKLTGQIPSDICQKMPKLQVLFLWGNQLGGQIPSNISECRDLENLSLTTNRLGGIPSELGRMRKLKELQLGRNDFKGNIPSFIFNISTLESLQLAFNQFSGSLPLDLGLSLFNLERLYLNGNKLSGPIPSSITNASKLVILEMGNNLLSGSIPNFENLRLLNWFGISVNNLNGAESPNQELGFLSSLTSCRYLESLALSYNPLNGILPYSIGNFSTSVLKFWASNCNINGVIPFEMGNLSSLIDISLDGNQLTGFNPTAMGNLKLLQILNLDHNQLKGYIPNELCQMSNLGELSLIGNMFMGPIPECLGEVKSIRNIYLGSNNLSSNIPSNFWNLKDLLVLDLSSNYLSGQLSFQIENLKAIYSLDLSFNQFLGDIPSIIDGCKSLETLKLSNNKFSGSIPKSLGNIRGLMTLDLSNNNLSGLIPQSLQDLKFLEHFNVSYNKLEGEIPNEGCFINFTAQSFVNNSALCGVTKFQVPPCSENHGRSRSKSFVQLLKYTIPPFISTIILVIIILMLIRRRKQENMLFSTDISLGIEWRRVSYVELEQGTSSFSENSLLGRGSFGSVFKGTLFDGLNVAVKVFSLQLEGAVKSFYTESEILSTVRHRNLVHIIGCCSNPEFKALILAYMPNGSLEKWLYSNTYSLDLVQRLNIAIDVAFALEYLHHGHAFPVVHCDIKPSNVLLDENMTAHVGDFGIAKLFDKGEAMIQTTTLATIGYAAPEYGTEGKVSTNGDVYSYGIMLLEMFTRKKPTDDMFSGEMSLKEWVSKALQQIAINEVLAPGLLSIEDEHFSAKQECVLSIFKLAMKCLVISPKERINMIDVGVVLHKIKARVVADTNCIKTT